MKITLLSFVAIMGSIWSTIAPAEDVKSPVGEAQAFLDQVRAGHLPEGAEVILNVDGRKNYLTKDKARDVLAYCREGTLQWITIYASDGRGVDPHEKTVMTKFSCRRKFVTYTGSAGVILFRDDKIIRLIIQADGYAPHYQRKAK